MNLREFWAAEAAKLRDTSALLDTSALSPAPNSKKKQDNTFKTGYWIEQSPLSNAKTIVFSTFVFNGTSSSQAEAEKLLKTAGAIFEKFKDSAKNREAGSGVPLNEEYFFDFRYQFVDEPRYDYNKTHRNYAGKNPKLVRYRQLYSEKPFAKELPWIYNDSALPNEYYMELFDEPNHGAGLYSEGGAHPNNNNRTKSCYFGLYVSAKIDRARVLIHECLHPLIEHTWANKSAIAPIWKHFFMSATEIVKTKSKSELELYLKNNKDNLKTEAIAIRENIMTTTGFIDETVYTIEEGKYLYFGEMQFYSGFSNGTKIHPLQVQRIIEQIK